MSAITIFDISRYAPLLGATVALGVLSAPADRPAQACGVPAEPSTPTPTPTPTSTPHSAEEA